MVARGILRNFTIFCKKPKSIFDSVKRFIQLVYFFLYELHIGAVHAVARRRHVWTLQVHIASSVQI